MAAEEKPTSVRAVVIGSLALVIVTALIIVAANWRAFFGATNPTPPEEAAKAWADKLKLPYRGAACTMFDSDDDGYVSCVLALDGADKVYFQGLQCGELGSKRGGGCKPDSKNPEVHLVLELTTTGAPHAPAQ
jgi:hypothetical protein